MEDAVTVEDSEEATLHCSIRGYQLYGWRIEHAPVCEKVNTMRVGTEFTIQRLSPQSLHCSCKDTIGYVPFLTYFMYYSLFSKEGDITAKLQ